MPKSSKQKSATQPKPSKPALSSGAKAAQCERVTEYKNAKALTVASSVKGKVVRYYDDDDRTGNDGDNDDDEEGGGGSDDEGMEEGEELEPKYQPYKLKCRNFIFIPDKNSKYTQQRSRFSLAVTCA
ncbi:unnamed protein product [Rhizoctonia solani]|uniref:Uncharacterized protein n=1 Tax=Rhizoctonia solani TaxID=456999 RepID=A0A8H3BDV3_9AGAM|nr:unnamed protein product [Rhizoctonia solani]